MFVSVKSVYGRETGQSLRGARPNKSRLRSCSLLSCFIDIGMGRLLEVASNDNPRQMVTVGHAIYAGFTEAARPP